MKKIKSSKFLNIFLILSLLLLSVNLYADKETESEGTTFWFGLPFCDRAAAETLRGSETNSPYELFVTSKLNTVVRVYVGDQLFKTVSVLANKPMVIALPDGFENQVSEKIEKKGIYVESDDPIAIVVYVSWRWTGEAFRVVPTDWLGTEYYTLNLYEDYNKDYSGSFRYHPAQILVVASEDGTEVSYTPTYETQKGVKKGQTKTIQLDKGDCFNIMGKLDPTMNQSWETDLTGTNIKASKPIAVYSGHTKGSFPRHSATMLGLKSDFMRNMYMDAMWPVSLLGTDYVQAPIMYTGRTQGYGTVPEDRGDIIRFVAIEDGTSILQSKSDGSGFVKIAGPINKGEDFRIMESMVPAYYKTNKPVLVGQYGKSWWQSPVSSKVDDDTKEDDELQNPPKNGQGMMFTLTPNANWCNYSGFNSPKGGMYNYTNILCRAVHVDSILFDGRRLKDEFGSLIKKIPGTEFSYVSAPVNAGGHVVQGMTNNITFAVYAYGNLDGGKDGFAYGYPAAVNYLSPCNDTIYLKDTMICETVEATITVEDIQTDVTCAGILRLEYDKESTKYAKFVKEYFKVGDKEAKFKIIFRNNRVDTIVVRAMTKSGNTLVKRYIYAPEIVESNKSYLSFGLLEIGKDKELTFEITNTGTKPAFLKRIYFNPGIPEFNITSPTNLVDITILPGQKIPVTVKAGTNDPEAGNLRAEIWVELECYSERLVILTGSPGEPKLTFNDLTWNGVPVNTKGDEKIVYCTNTGDADGEIYDYNVTGIDGDHFVDVALYYGLTFPIIIPANREKIPVLKLKYTPLTEEGVIHTVTAFFETNARVDQIKLNSVWIGSGITAGPTITDKDWLRQRVIDDWQIEHNIYQYDGVITVNNIGNSKLNVESIVIENDDNIFVLDKNVVDSIKLNGMIPNSPINIPVVFKPNAQKTFMKRVIITGEFAGQTKTAIGILQGDGIQPHVEVIDKDMGSLNLNKNNTIEDIVWIKFKKVASNYDNDLTITDIYLDEDDVMFFRINTDKFTMPSNAQPITLGIRDSIGVPIIYQPTVTGNHKTKIKIVCDAPIEDDTLGIIIANSFNYSVTTTDYNFAPVYITLTDSNGYCNIKNTGVIPLKITQPLNMDNITKIGDVSEFQILHSFLASTPNITYDGNSAKDIVIPPGEILVLKLSFKPLEVRDDYTMTIKYFYNTLQNDEPIDLVATSKITGIGQDYKLVVEIPKGYKAYPGEIFGENGKPFIEYKLYPNSSESKILSDANIKKIKLTILFDETNNANRNIYPLIQSASDIYTQGTLTENWTVDYVEIQNDNLIYLQIHSDNALGSTNPGSKTLFKFKLQSYLSDLKLIPLRCDFIPQDESYGYVKVDRIDGDVQINEVCIDTARLIFFSGLNYNSSIIQNPVVNTLNIDYTVPINCSVELSIFDIEGRLITTLISEKKSPGTYNLTKNTDNLNSGQYILKTKIGPYIKTEIFNIVK